MKADRFEFGDELILQSATRKDFVVCNPDTQSCGLEYFDKINPNHAFMFGIAEQNLVDAAAGIASCDTKVYVSTFAVFLTMRSCEQIRQFICYPNLDVTLLGCHTGLQIGKDGGTHTAVEDVGIMRSLPNMSIIQPSDGIVARSMARFSLDFHTPLYVRLHRSPLPEIHSSDYEFRFNQADILLDLGDDVAIVTTGAMTYKALEAAQMLRQKGIKAKVVDVTTLKPIDKETLISVAQKTGSVVTLEDHNIYGGLGSAVAEVLSQNYPTRMLILGIKDKFGESGEPDDLYAMHRLMPAQIAEDIEMFVRSR